VEMLKSKFCRVLHNGAEAVLQKKLPMLGRETDDAMEEGLGCEKTLN
jgi:hypothetical protein